MRLTVAVAVALAVWSPVHPLFADEVTGNMLLQSCSGTEGDTGLGYCYGFIRGEMDALAGVGELNGKVCMTGDIPNDEMKDVFVKYLKDHPNQRHFMGAALLEIAMEDGYPC